MDWRSKRPIDFVKMEAVEAAELVDFDLIKMCFQKHFVGYLN